MKHVEATTVVPDWRHLKHITQEVSEVDVPPFDVEEEQLSARNKVSKDQI